MTFEVVAVGELQPDFFSSRIESLQSRRAGRSINYSHLAILVNGSRVFDATERGVAECSLEELLDRGQAVIRKRVAVPVVRNCCAVTWLQARVGSRYSWAQILALAFPFLRALPYFRNGRAEVVCSEYVADFLHDCTSLPKGYFAQNDWKMPYHVMDHLDTVLPPGA